MATQIHTYTSSNASFLSFDDWYHTPGNVSEEERTVRIKVIELNDDTTTIQEHADLLQATYIRWIGDQSILTHTVTEDGIAVYEELF